jgi:hypothetical protein
MRSRHIFIYSSLAGILWGAGDCVCTTRLLVYIAMPHAPTLAHSSYKHVDSVSVTFGLLKGAMISTCFLAYSSNFSLGMVPVRNSSLQHVLFRR